MSRALRTPGLPPTHGSVEYRWQNTGSVLDKYTCDLVSHPPQFSALPFIPNYGERFRQGERISTGFVESAVNQVVSKRMSKRQQMQWSRRGAHLLLQTRTRVLNNDLEETFRGWYPEFRPPATTSNSSTLEARPPEI